MAFVVSPRRFLCPSPCLQWTWPWHNIVHDPLHSPFPPSPRAAPPAGGSLFSFGANSTSGPVASNVPAFSFGAAPAFGAATPAQEEDDEPEKDEPEVGG